MTDKNISGLPPTYRFLKGRSLKWGCTPFDDLTRDELLRVVQAYHSALVSHSWPMQLMMSMGEGPFWQPGGAGYPAKVKAAALERLTGWDQDGGEAQSRAFFRYADDLLFPGLLEPWTIYPDGSILKPAREPGGRPLEWSDLSPKAKAA